MTFDDAVTYVQTASEDTRIQLKGDLTDKVLESVGLKELVDIHVQSFIFEDSSIMHLRMLFLMSIQFGIMIGKCLDKE